MISEGVDGKVSIAIHVHLNIALTLDGRQRHREPEHPPVHLSTMYCGSCPGANFHFRNFTGWTEWLDIGSQWDDGWMATYVVEIDSTP